MSQIGASMDESQLALATERFQKLRSELEAKPVWMTEKSRKKRTSDKEKLRTLLDWHSKALVQADAYPGEHVRLKTLIEKMENTMNKDDMLEILSSRQRHGLSIAPLTSSNKPSYSRGGCLGVFIFLVLLALGIGVVTE
jgi:hypothetical protein